MALKDLTAPMVASENRLAWNPAPPSPSDGKQLVDSATLDGINKGINDAEYQKMAQEYAANEAALQQIQNQRLQSGLLGPTPQEQAMYQSELTNRYLTNLVGAKQAYQNAQVSQDEAGMANASLVGQQLREQGRAAGIDPALLSTDLTLDQARELQGQLEWQSVFNGMSADDYYQVQYNRYRDQGMGYTAAKRAAGADAAQYQAQQAARSSDAIFKYGLDGNGALNARGMQALMHMVQTGGDSGREMANIIANMLPGMKDAYSLNAQRALMGDRQGYQERTMALGHQYKEAEADSAWKRGEAKANNDVQRALYQVEQMVGINAMSDEAKAVTRARIADYVGLTGDAKQRYITTGRMDAPKGSGNSGSGVSQTKKLETQGKIKSLVDQFMSGDSDMSVDDFRAEVDKLTPYLEDDDVLQATEELIMTRNFLKEYKNNFAEGDEELNPNTKAYWQAIANDSSLLSWIPKEIQEDMRRRVSQDSGNAKEQAGTPAVASYPEPQISDETKAMAQNVAVAAAENKARNPYDVASWVESLVSPSLSDRQEEIRRQALAARSN